MKLSIASFLRSCEESNCLLIYACRNIYDILEISGLWSDVAEDSNSLGYNAASSRSVYLTICWNIPEELNF
jgi:hypothetical protein